MIPRIRHETEDLIRDGTNLHRDFPLLDKVPQKRVLRQCVSTKKGVTSHRHLSHLSDVMLRSRYVALNANE
jgi:hypothetical protein